MACIATGPSLTAGQLAHLARFRGIKTIAVNEAGLPDYLPLAWPQADILYAADSKWWRYYRPQTSAMHVSAEEVEECTIDGVQVAGVETVVLEILQRDEPMPRTPGAVLGGNHSGFQALGLALTLGASRVLLLGYDCGGGARNCHTERPAQFTRSGGSFMTSREFYNRVPLQFPEVEVINCSPLTAITAFPVQPIEEALP